MSVQASAWVIEHSKHKGSDLLCLLMIANHAHADGSNAFPSIETLARECRLSARQITRIIQNLEASGELCVDRSTGRTAHTYRVVMAPPNPAILSPLNPDKMAPLDPDKMTGLKKPTLTNRAPNPDKSRKKGPPHLNIRTVNRTVNKESAQIVRAPEAVAVVDAVADDAPKPNPVAVFIDEYRAAFPDFADPEIPPRYCKALKDRQAALGPERYRATVAAYLRSQHYQAVQGGHNVKTFCDWPAETWERGTAAKPAGGPPARREITLDFPDSIQHWANVVRPAP